MKEVGVLAILALCLVLANGNISKDIKKISDKLGLHYITTRQLYLRSEENYEMTAKFNINGVEDEKRVIKRWFVMYIHDTIKLWVKTESIQMVNYYLDGSSPMKVTTLHANGTLGVQYIGSLMDKRCKILNCKYEFVQPVGSIMKKEVIDPEGWVLLSVVVSPNLEGEAGFTVVFDSELTCSL